MLLKPAAKACNTSGVAPFVIGKKPELHFRRALGWFHKADLEECKAQILAGSVHAPLTNDLHQASLDLFQMRWSGVEAELIPEDWDMFKHLCLPESPDFILNLPDYYAFFTYTMFHGKVVG